MGKLAYCPQNTKNHLTYTVAEALEIDYKLKALEELASGSTKEKLFEIINNDWDLKAKVQNQLRKFGLPGIEFNRPLSSMSGGEITKLWLAKAFFNNADFVLLDEPTNNLDYQSKQLLYEAIRAHRQGLIVVNHDQELLEQLDRIVELSSVGVTSYGGNYSHYLEQKNLAQLAAFNHYQDAKKQLARTKRLNQETTEKHDKRQAQGRKIRKDGSQPKVLLDYAKNSSEKALHHLNIKKERLIEKACHQLKITKEGFELNKIIKIELPKTHVPTDKLITNLEQVSYCYQPNQPAIISKLNLTIKGPERIVILGNNGSGKTTLAKLLLGKLKPSSGQLTIGTNFISYLDQELNILNVNLTILDNYLAINPTATELQARYHLANFLFRNHDALQVVKTLSRGEALRAALCSALTADQPPQLLILDEPTNHLDLPSITALEAALNCYRGALVVISHDQKFTSNLSITKTLVLKKQV